MVLCLVKIWRVPEPWEEIRGHRYVEKNLSAMFAWEMASDLPASLRAWPCGPHPYTDTSLSPRISQILFRSLVMQFWWWNALPHFLVLCRMEWEVAALCRFSPSNSRLNDVCILKWPPAHCLCVEMSFIWPVEQVLPRSLLTEAVFLKAARDVPSVFVWFCCTLSSEEETVWNHIWRILVWISMQLSYKTFNKTGVTFFLYKKKIFK